MYNFVKQIMKFPIDRLALQKKSCSLRTEFVPFQCACKLLVVCVRILTPFKALYS